MGEQRASWSCSNSSISLHQEQHAAEVELAARIESFELAYRMQTAAPGEALDLRAEPGHIRRLYGLDDPAGRTSPQQCLIARRLVERGVRFVQIYSGGMENQRPPGMATLTSKGIIPSLRERRDRPVAGLLTDLVKRGLLDETLVIGAASLDGCPIAQTGDKPGRDTIRTASRCGSPAAASRAASAMGNRTRLAIGRP